MWRPILMLLALFCSSSHQQCFSKNDATQFIGKPHIKAWKIAQQNFSVNMLQILNSMDKDGDVVFSPVGIYEALLISYFGASYDTERSLARILNLPLYENKGKIWRLYYTQSLVTQNKIRDYPLKTANKFYLTHRLRLRPCMDRKMRGLLELVDYDTDPSATESYINNWVEQLTDGKIKNYIQGITSHTTSTLVSAAYFNGLWSKQFDPSMTQLKDFHVNDNDIRPVEMMYKIDHVLTGYDQTIEARTMVLPYAGSNVAMIILLPDGSLDDMIASMNERTIDYVTDRRNYIYHTSQIHMPKMKIENQLDMKKVYSALGHEKTFTPYANFTGFTGRPEVFLNALNHQAMIDVKEDGTVGQVAMSAFHEANFYWNSLMTFSCDHPFAYIIYDFTTNKILIMGTIRYPPGIVAGPQ